MQFDLLLYRLLLSLSPRIPNKFKRMVFLTSLLAMLRDTRSGDERILKHVNHFLCLAHDDRSMNLPLYTHRWIWKGISSGDAIILNAGSVQLKEILSSKLTTDDYHTIVDYFLKTCPAWMVYSDRKTIYHDVRAMIHILNSQVSHAK